ncbi:hypothetical protein ElyMa_003588600 [Elysia marginata]|uniref:Uncharacterized protein n=1 Tax=Elysia marginata TaxID=1093978 RepID=A0AAV4EPE5_9GAST|nr:hypothetical protein ElyMa_003588600 [Elysia marginata]
MDLSPADRLTRKRNMLLQKQLDVQLQIIREEYRMTRKDLDKGSKTLAEFLICLRHTAPGLQTYGQPDTRAMNAKSILLERRYELEGGEPGSDAVDGNKGKASQSSLGERTKRRPQSSKESLQRTGSAKDRSNERGDDIEDGAADRQKASSASAYRNEFFNRRIVLDSKRRSFLQHALDKNAGAPKGASKSDNPKPSPRAATHSGFYSNRDTKGEISTRPKSSTTPRTQRPVTPKYGREAESKMNEDSRKNVLEMFDVIFDPASDRPNGRIRSAGTTATPIYVPKEAFGPPVPVLDNCADQNPPPSNTKPTTGGANHPNGYLLNRRVAWSAPPKRRETPPIRPSTANQTSENNSNHPNRESQSVTPRSGTKHLIATTNSPRPRPKSHVPRASRELHTSSPSDTSGQQSPRPCTGHHERTPRKQSSCLPNGQLNGHADFNVDHKEPRVFTRRVVTQQELDMRRDRQRALGHMMNYVGAAAKQRPKASPQPNYELMRRSVAAPRQQVAGILAEIQSRRADTRAMLTKSKQIKTMVQTLVPEDMSPDESFSD